MNRESTNGNIMACNGLATPESVAKGACHEGVLSQCSEDIVRLIGQQLRNMGFTKTAELLSEESGCRLEHPTAANFRAHVENGAWKEAVESLGNMAKLLENQDERPRVLFLLLEAKYLELLEAGLTLEAVQCLRHELTPLKLDTARVHQLSSYMMCSSAEELYQMSGWHGGQRARQQLMDKLQGFFPASVMLPPHRMEQLLKQAVTHQAEQCRFHNMGLDTMQLMSMSLLSDHVCSKKNFPCRTKQTLTAHQDEVWFCRFSHDGTRLATGSKDSTVFIWNAEVEPLEQLLKLDGHQGGAGFLAFSPDDKYLLVCGTEEVPEAWLWDVTTGVKKCSVGQTQDDSLTTAAWFEDSKQFVVGGSRGHFYHCNIDGQILNTWEGVRVNALAIPAGGNLVLAGDTHDRVRSYNFEENCDQDVFREDHSIMSMSVSADGRRVLLNCAKQGVHLWDIKDKIRLRKFQGLTQGHYTIYSCFGGVNGDFIASGSEDQKIYIWHWKREIAIRVLTGHQRTVNCVSWNPTQPSMLASASDDGTVRIWGAADSDDECE